MGRKVKYRKEVKIKDISVEFNVVLCYAFGVDEVRDITNNLKIRLIR